MTPGESVTPPDRPEQVVERAARALHALEYDGAMPEDIEAAWDGNPDERELFTKQARAVLAAVAEPQRPPAYLTPQTDRTRRAVSDEQAALDAIVNRVDAMLLKPAEGDSAVSSQESHGRVGEPPMKGAKGER
jgi:hypothetical protein